VGIKICPFPLTLHVVLTTVQFYRAACDRHGRNHRHTNQGGMANCRLITKDDALRTVRLHSSWDQRSANSLTETNYANPSPQYWWKIIRLVKKSISICY